MANQPGIVIYFSDYENVGQLLSQEQKGDLLDALIAFGREGQTYTGGDNLVGMAFNVHASAIRRTEKKYNERCQRNAENIRKRWEKQKSADNTVVYDRIPTDTTGYERGENKNKTETENETQKQKRKIFIPPTVEEVAEYCKERGNTINAEQFVDYYAARGWELKQGQKMKDWKASVRTWEQNQRGWTSELRGGQTGDRVRGQRDLYDV